MLTLIVFSSNACWIGVIAIASLAGKSLVFTDAKPTFNFSVPPCSDLAPFIGSCGGWRSLIIVQGLYAPVNIVFVLNQ